MCVRLTLYAPPIQLGFYFLTSLKIHWPSSLRLMFRMCLFTCCCYGMLTCSLTLLPQTLYPIWIQLFNEAHMWGCIYMTRRILNTITHFCRYVFALSTVKNDRTAFIHCFSLFLSPVTTTHACTHIYKHMQATYKNLCLLCTSEHSKVRRTLHKRDDFTFYS